MNDWAVAALLLEGLLAIVTAVWVVASIAEQPKPTADN